MYESVLRRTGIHRPDESGRWVIDPPSDQGVVELWKAVETFFTEAIGEPRSLDGLYAKLQSPPFGVKAGVIPVMIASVLLYRSDDVSLYRDGTFVPVLGAEQFEILVKHPARFAVKHFALTGLRRNLFRELESLLTRSNARLPETTRNTSLLGVVRPLVRFATSLRATTRKSTSLSPMAVAVRDALLSATEPDRLLFETLPLACGVEPFGTMDGEEAAETGAAISSPDDRRQVVFRRALLKALAELETHYERRLEECRTRLYDAFAVSAAAGSLREHLRVRAHYLLGRCIEPRLRAFTQAAADGIPGDREWLEALAMVVADRPADTWTDNDMLTFEVNLSDIARRFIHLESLQREAAADGREGFDARRVTITKPDGHEAHQLVWLDRSERDLIDSRVERLLHDIEDVHHVHQRRAIAVALAERLLTINSEGSDAGAPAASIAKVPEGSRRRKNG